MIRNIIENNIEYLMTPKRGHSGQVERTTIYINKENKEFAQRFGINLSVFFDNCLEELVKYLRGYTYTPGAGLEPASPEGHGLSRPAQYHSATPAQ